MLLKLHVMKGRVKDWEPFGGWKLVNSGTHEVAVVRN